MPGVPFMMAIRICARQRHWFEHAYLVPICLLACLAFAWFDTLGDWNFFRPESFGQFYDAQGASLLHGRLDVPKSAAAFEAFVRDGKYYGYFGMVPALPRMVLNSIWPSRFGQWSRLSLMIACVVNVLLACRLGILADESIHPDRPGTWRKTCIALFVTSASLGSTNIFIASRAHTFHEAIIWGSAFALACGYAGIRYLQSDRRSWLAVAGFCALLAFFTRVTVGAGAFAFLLMLAGRAVWRARVKARSSDRSSLRGHAAIALAVVGLGVCLYFAINYAKFRSLDGVPLRLYQQYIADPRRMKITGGRQIHPENLRAGLYNYFAFAGVEMHRGFPWIFMTDHPTIFPETHMDAIEPFSSIPVGEPGLTLLALIGCAAMMLWRTRGIGDFRLPTLAMFGGGAVVLITVGITERYMHDFYPFLVLAGAAGAARVGAVNRRFGRLLIGGILIPVTLLGVYINGAFALDSQRTAERGVPDAKEQQYIDWQSAIDAGVTRWLEKR